MFYGVAPGVMAIIAIAAYRLAKVTNRRDLRLWAISACLAIVTAVTGAEIAVLFLAAGLLMIVLDAPPAFLRRRRPPALPALALPALLALPARPGRTATTVAARTAAALGALAGGGTLVALALFFLKTGAFTFGSGLAIVPFLREGVVTQHHWLDDRQFLDAVAMGLITRARSSSPLRSSATSPPGSRERSSRPSRSSSRSTSGSCRPAAGSSDTRTTRKSKPSSRAPPRPPLER